VADEALELLAGQVDETVPGVKVLGGVELVALLTSKIQDMRNSNLQLGLPRDKFSHALSYVVR
jgi:hypothetical protein